MIDKNGIRHNWHSVTSLKVQFVITTKYREKLFRFNIKESAFEIINNICTKYDIQLLGSSIEPEHIHLVLEYPPSLSVSRMANLIKGILSHELRKKYGILKDFCIDSFLSDGFGAFSMGNDLEIVLEYLNKQGNQGVAA
jgi:putative transposase